MTPRRLLPLLAVIPALSLAAPAIADTAATAPQRQVTVTGHGEVSAVPDIARISISIVRQAKAAKDALAANSAAMNAVTAALSDSGIAPEDMQTGGFAVEPLYQNQSDVSQPPKIAGYQVRNGVNLTIRKLADLGPVIDRVVALGSNEIGGIDFDIARPESLLDEARRRAIADAARKAKLYAEGAGASLGSVQIISEQAVSAPVPMLRMKTMASEGVAAAPTPVAAGQQTLTADVTAVWELK